MTLAHPSTLPRPAISSVHGWRSVLVHLGVDAAADRRLAAALDLARRFDARLVGVAAQRVDRAILAAGPGAAETYEAWREDCLAQLAAAGERFLATVKDHPHELRTIEERPDWVVPLLSRCADVLVTGGEASSDRQAGASHITIALSSGRPVLVAPAAGAPLRGEAVLVAWKDAREARRAVADALPLLRRAADVLVLQVCARDQRVSAEMAVGEVVEALAAHGVPARAQVVHAAAKHVAETLRAEARLAGADLIVAGCYGRSRAREWVFGGVSRDLLHNPGGYLLMSH